MAVLDSCRDSCREEYMDILSEYYRRSDYDEINCIILLKAVMEIRKEYCTAGFLEVMKVRELGYKPYIAPSLSSAALSILLTLRGQWHYSSLYLGDGTRGAFLGIRNRMTEEGPEYEEFELCDPLYTRIRHGTFPPAG